jgi:hypothetical protein
LGFAASAVNGVCLILTSLAQINNIESWHRSTYHLALRSYKGAQWSIPSVRMIDLQKFNDATRGLQAAETIILKTISFEQKGYQAVAVDALTR